MPVIVPPIKSQGIKTKLVPWIQSLVPDAKGRWIEPFLGTGVVAFNCGFRRAVLGDANPHVIRFYRQVQRGVIYRVIGAEDSPYSVKVRSYFRYKGIAHEWLSRHEASELFQKHARLPPIPLVVTPDERGIQDSTPIIEALEPEFNESGIHPPDAVSAFVSALLEEFGDQWGNKWMFHLRWAREIDQIGCARRLAASSMPNATAAQIDRAAKAVRERMVDRVWFVGSNAVTAPQIERSFKDALGFLEAHLAGRPYLFGGRPAFAELRALGTDI